MSRPLRITYPGAWYHVMHRGAGRRAIFKTDAQRQHLLSLLADTHEKFQADWHAYCLMDNHYHLMVHTPAGNLPRIMRQLNGLYTQYYNRTEKTDGALFRGRYRAILVDADAYWLTLSRYIHRNPLEARLTTRLADYRWSSYPAYVGRVNAPPWLSTEFILQAIGRRNPKARYKAFVSGNGDAALDRFYGSTQIAPILGDAPFKTKVLAGTPPHPDLADLRRARTLPSADKLIKTVAHYYGVSAKSLYTPVRGKAVTTPARSMAMYLCQYRGEVTLAAIANTFGLASYASAGATIRNFKVRLESARGLRRELKYILLDLTP